MSKWIEEELEPGLRVSYGLAKVLDSSVSKFQTVDLVDLTPFGRALMIDGLMQSCQCDEFVYHESLVHPALLAHPCPKTWQLWSPGSALEVGAEPRGPVREDTRPAARSPGGHSSTSTHP